MYKLVVSAFTITSFLICAGIAIASPQVDLGLDAERMFFRFTAPGVDTSFQMLPGNRHHPIVLPCDVEMFGGQLDINYPGAGPTVFPKLTATFFDDKTGTPIVSTGCLNNQVLPNVYAQLGALAPGSTQVDGYTPISSTHQFCPWLFQPQDLPENKLVRMHLELTAHQDSTYTGLIADSNLADNGRDVFVVRGSCSCQ